MPSDVDVRQGGAGMCQGSHGKVCSSGVFSTFILSPIHLHRSVLALGDYRSH
jgi:hypothetical protein